VLIEL
jgi:hypothetical protein